MQLMQYVRRIFFVVIFAAPALAQTTFSCPANQYVSTQQINAGQGCSTLPVTVQTGAQNVMSRYTTAGTGTTVGASSVQTDATGTMLGVNVVPTHALDLAASSSATSLTSTNTAEAEVINTNGAANTYEGVGLKANNAAASAVTFAKIAAVNTAVTAGAESGDLHFVARNAGTLVDWWQMLHGGGLTSTGVTGGDKGAGTINAAGLYVNGVAVGSGGGTVGTSGTPASGNMTKFSGASTITNAVAGTDYQGPITLTTTGSSGAATLTGTTLNIPSYAAGASVYAWPVNAAIATSSSSSVLPFSGVINTLANETRAQFAAPLGGTARNLYLYVAQNNNTQSSTGSLVCTLRVNGANTALTVTVAASQAVTAPVSDTTHTATFSAGALLNLGCVNSATAASVFISAVSMVVQ